MSVPFSVIWAAFGIFFAMFLMQMLVQRFYKPVSEDKFIIGYFALLPFLCFIGLLAFRFFGLVPVDYAVMTYLLFFVISSSWVASYPAVYAVCPTLIMSYVIDRNKTGTPAQEIVALLSLKQNSQDRIEDAVHDKWITKTGDKVQLTWIGRTALCFFTTYRRLLGLKLETL